MADNGMKGRVKGLLHGPGEEMMDLPDQESEPGSQQQSLQILQLAQRTADEYIVNAKREADRICSEAQTQAEQIIRDAQAQGQARRQEAEKGLTEAQSKAEQIARDAQVQADSVRRDAEGILSEARSQAADIVKNAKAHAEDVEHEAQRKYEDVVGSLGKKRDALQSQIESLQSFEHAYRSRLTVFLQNHLRALWVEEPEKDSDDAENSTASTTDASAQSAPDGRITRLQARRAPE